MSLVVACYLWNDPEWKHTGTFRYGPEHVRRLRDAVDTHLTVPHRFVCATNMDVPGVETIPLDMTTHVPGREWVKLMTFSPHARALFGADRVLQLDLDGVICANIDHIVNREEPLVMWRNPSRVPWRPTESAPGQRGQKRALYNGSMILHELGSATDIWYTFVDNREHVVRLMRDTQVLQSKMLGWDCPHWDHHDGVFRLERDDTPGSGIAPGCKPPEHACIVFFPGSEHKPWLPKVRDSWAWLEEYWPLGLTEAQLKDAYESGAFI